MRPVSAAFLSTLRGSHTALSRVRVVEPFQTGVEPVGTELAVLGGSVSLDGHADVRATLDVEVDGTGMWPGKPTDLLAPYGNELYVERGLMVGNTPTWVGLGYYRIYTPEQSEPPDGPIRISARDRMSGIIDSKLEAPVAFTPNHTIAQVYERLVLDVYPDADIVYDFLADGIALNRAAVVEEDRYTFLRDVALSLGRVMYFDYAGRLQVRTPPSLRSPVWTVDYGHDGVLTSLSRALTREGVFNAVAVEGEAADDRPPARATARDMGPDSPTYWFGKFGKVVRRVSSPLVTSTSQAANVARTELAKAIGAPYTVDFGVVPNPALEPFDPILIRLDSRAVDERHVIQTLSIGLGPEDGMTGTSREITQSSIDVGEDL